MVHAFLISEDDIQQTEVMLMSCIYFIHISLKLIQSILCYSYQAFSCIQYINQQIYSIMYSKI